MQFIGPEDLPPGLLEHIQQQHDLHHMSIDDSRHQLMHFIDSLSEEQLNQLWRMVDSSGHMIEGGSTPMSNYYEGLISSWLLFKYKVCFCGEKHSDSVPDDFLKEGQQSEEEEGDPLPEIPPDNFDGDQLIKHYGDLLKLYNMEVVPVIPENPKVKVLRCKGCQTPSVNMRDRMLREPGVKGCSPCQQKAKFG